MSARSIPLSIYERKSPLIIQNLQICDFSKGLTDVFEFEIAVVNEPSVFEPLKLYCSWITPVLYIRLYYLII